MVSYLYPAALDELAALSIGFSQWAVFVSVHILLADWGLDLETD